MTKTVEGKAHLLQAVAGYDGIDDRAGPQCPSPESLPLYIMQLCLGILPPWIFKEVFQINLLYKSIAPKIRDATNKFTIIGATIEDVSIPFHRYSSRISQVLSRVDGANAQSGRPSSGRALYTNELTEKCFFTLLRQHPRRNYFTVRNTRLVGEYAWKNYPAACGKAMDLARQLRDQYDKELQKYDIFVLPVVNYPGSHANPTAPSIVQSKKFRERPS
jgi:amidase